MPRVHLTFLRFCALCSIITSFPRVKKIFSAIYRMLPYPIGNIGCKPFYSSTPLGFVRRFATMAPAASPLGPRPLVLCGPSGSGKSTLIKRLMAEFQNVFGFSVSHTTRSPRPGETDGKEYHFVSKEVIEAGIMKGDFIETATFSGNIYGTSKKAVEDVQRKNKICILDIEMQGVKSIRKTNLNPHYIFMKPPSMEVLEQRLRARSTETEESLQKRLETAKGEMEYGSEPGNFDIVIVNDQLDVAYEELKTFLLPFIEEVKY